MKEATGEVSGTVITIVIVALVLGIGIYLFSSDGPARNWIEGVFGKVTNTKICVEYDGDGNCLKSE